MQVFSTFKSYILCLLLICSPLFIKTQQTGSVFGSHAQLLQSFQNEMKSLEAAAHRVNSLLMNSNLNNNANNHVGENGIEDSTPPQKKENKNFEFTVFAKPNILHDGIIRKEEPSTEAAIQSSGNQQYLDTKQILKFGPFGSLFSSFNNKLNNVEMPWWRGKNVCVEKSNKIEDIGQNEDMKDKEAQFLIFGSGSFKRCRQTATKYVCTTVVSSPTTTKTLTITYECCEGFHREGNSCVGGDSTGSDDSASGTINDYKSEVAMNNNVENENTKNIFQFLPLKVTLPNEVTEKNTEINTDKKDQSDEKSYSSQSDEVEGKPVWLHNYINGQRIRNLFNL